MAKIGIYGGTFNPIHNGHINIITEFYRRLGFDRVLIIPTSIPPHKTAESLAENEDRIKMCQLATETLNINAVVSDIEMKRSDKSYTADTLLELRSIYPQDEFYFIMGEDMFLTINRWYRPEVIFRQAVLCASPRSSDGFKRMCSFAEDVRREFPELKYIVEDIPYIPVSSTNIRNNRESLEKDVPAAVSEYILAHRLYNYNYNYDLLPGEGGNQS